MPTKSPVHSLEDCRAILRDVFVHIASVNNYKRDIEVMLKNVLYESPVGEKPSSWDMLYFGSQFQRLLYVADHLHAHLALPEIADPDWSDLMAATDLSTCSTLVDKLPFLPSHLSKAHIQNPMQFIQHCFAQQSIKKWSKQLNRLLETCISSGSIADELDEDWVNCLYHYPALLEAMYLVFVRWGEG